jgi:PTS system glucose-specific IIC component
MFKNAFANLQKVGKSLMLPVSVLPIAGILLGVGSTNFSWLPAVVSHVMAEAGGSVFANMPLIFAIGVALGFTNNDGVSALASVVATASWLRPWLLLRRWFCIYLLKRSQLNTLLIRVFSGGLSPVRLQRICSTASTVSNCLSILASLGKRFVPIISGLAAIFTGVVLSFIWPPIGTAIQTFSQWAAYQNPVVAFGIYGFIERCLVPFGLHHIWNVPFQMQIGEYTNAAGQVFHGDILAIWRVTRLRANCPVASCSKCTVCRLLLSLSGTLLNQKTARKWAVS